ncbi:MAG: D-aminoacyl-tRNA deacylase [Bacteroidales bacterium]|nr:D-tyrosyl-tRNA(Tyr) deacylase [Candidatus Colimorpha merdihippi]MCQ2281331.1 D-aminoacyl-tRNA deacylase [Bacteroidales bacterium]
MRIVIQRCSQASVTINGSLKSQIGYGMLILLGIEDADTDDDIDYLCRKIVALRIFNDTQGIMNLDITQVPDANILLVSQFTLMASTRKGNRPSYIRASKPDFAIPMYNKFIARLSQLFGKDIQTGQFGADMQVSLTNDGPVTILIDSHSR